MPRREIDEQLLINSALEEFTLNSFEQASVNKIIANAKIAKGSFYYRFPNKYSLYIYLLKEADKKKWEFINNEINQDDASGKDDIFALFIRQAESGVRFAAAYPQYFKLGKMLSKEKGSPLYNQVLGDLKITDVSGLSRIIEEAYSTGTFGSEYSIEFVNKLLTSMFFSFDEIFFRDEEFELGKAMAYLHEFSKFLMHGLKK
ncbi:MAG: TetR/AcrR family transcriptional regulator [Spirochaetales bacterium]|nr:TetR/AcrR family transcriptional regulator [Spirochaetales bacterium]